MAQIIAPSQIIPDKMVPSIYSAGPTPTPLGVAAYRAPEAGYARMVPDTWYRSYWDPEVVDWHRIQTVNTGWESGIMGIGAQGGPLTVDRVVSKATHQAPFGLVETGFQTDPEWCCGWYDLLCDAQDCADQDLNAAILAAEKAGGGLVVDKPGGSVVAVVEVEEGAIWDSTKVSKPGDPGFEQKAAGAKAAGKKTVTKGSSSPESSPTPPPGVSPPPVLQARAGGGFKPWMLLAGVGIIGAVWYFQKGKK